MPISSGGTLLHPNAQASLQRGTVTTRAYVEIIGQGVFANGAMLSGDTPEAAVDTSRPHGWIHGAVSTSHVHAYTALSGGEHGNRQISMKITAGTQNVSNLTSTPSSPTGRSNALATFSSGQELEWEVAYRLPSGTSEANFFRVQVLHSASVEEVHRASGSTVTPSNPTGWVVKRGRVGPITDDGPGGTVLIYAGIAQSGATDANFEAIVSHVQAYPVRRIPPEDLLNYSWRKDTEFASAGGDITVRNNSGRYSYENVQGPLQYGDEIRMYEGTDLTPPIGAWDVQWLERYRGTVREIVMSNTGGISQIKATALDALVRLEDLEISGRWVGEESLVSEDPLYPTSLSGTDRISGEYRASVWSAGNYPWTQSSPPIIQIESPQGFVTPRTNTPEFNVSIHAGQLLFESPLSFIERVVTARYNYIVEPLQVEDLLESLLTSGDGFGFAPFNLSHNLRSSWSQQRSGVDVLTTNTVADSLPIRIRAESAGIGSGDYARLIVDGVDHSLNQAASYNMIAMNSGGVVFHSAAYSVTSNSDITTMSGDISGFASGTWVAVATRGTPVSFHISGSNRNMFLAVGARQFNRVFSGSLWMQQGVYDSGSWAFVGQKNVDSGTVFIDIPIPEVVGRTYHPPSIATKQIYAPYAAGDIWYTKYNRWVTALNSGDLVLPAGRTVLRQDPRLGAFVLSGALTSDTIYTTTDYEFSTLQATGIEMSEFEVTLQNVDTRLDAFRSIRDGVLPPNYILRTDQHNVWGSYFNQVTLQDYELRLASQYVAVGDDDVYTRVRTFGKNSNPDNLSFSPNTSVLDGLIPVTGSVTDLRLTKTREEEPDWNVYASVISGNGRIIAPPFPEVKVDGIDITNYESQQLILQEVRTKTILKTKGNSETFNIELLMAHKHIDPSESIILRDATGAEIIVITPGDDNSIGMEYEDGIFRPPNVYPALAGGNSTALLSTSIDMGAFFDYQIIHLSQLAFRVARLDGTTFPAGHTFEPYSASPDLNDVMILEVAESFLFDFKSRRTVGIVFEGFDMFFGPTDIYTAPQLGLSPEFPWVRFTAEREDWFETINKVPNLTTTSAVPVRRYYLWPLGNVQVPNQVIPTSYTIQDDGGIVTDGYLYAAIMGGANQAYGEEAILNGNFLGIATADYTIRIPPDTLRIEYDAGEFWLHTDLFGIPLRDPDSIKNPAAIGLGSTGSHTVEASYHFQTISVPLNEVNAAAMLNGSPDNETQVVYNYQPVPGTVLFTLDFGSVVNVDAIDISPGYYRPTGDRTGLFKFDVGFVATLKHSLDNVTYNVISKEAAQISLKTGSSVSLEETDLGDSFQTRYLRMELDNVDSVIWNGLRWPVSIAIFSIFSNVVLRGEAKLVDVVADSDVEVLDTFGLRQRFRDRLFKDSEVKDNLDTQTLVNKRAKDLLTEFNKNHTRMSVNQAYYPGMVPGVTVHVRDIVSGIDRNYFVEQVTNQNGSLQIRLAYFP